MTTWPTYGRITGPVVIIGFGSIGRGFLPLLKRHFALDQPQITIVEPSDEFAELMASEGVTHVKAALTPANFREILTPLLTSSEGQGFCVNLSVDTSSVEIMGLTREIGSLYIDTVVEPWAGFYDAGDVDAAGRSNYALRETLLAARRASPGGTTAVSCSGANPGMVSWFVKQALLNIATDLGIPHEVPKTQAGWAALMKAAGVKGVHIAERDTQRARDPKPMGTFINTWSVEGFIAEALQPAELGWGTHERWMPSFGRTHEKGSGAAIYLLSPGADTRVRSWCPTPGSQLAYLVTHNEAITIADYFTARDGDTVTFRPTVHYAYHPANDALLSLHEMFGYAAQPQFQPKHHILREDEIVDGRDELGVLLYGHAKNAYWYGSRLTIEEARQLAPYQNASGLQVTSAVMAGMVWALQNPEAGIVESDELDFDVCLTAQRPYLGTVEGVYTDWTPLTDRPGFFPEDIDESDPWQFRNVLVHQKG
ncbi:homospermidine synthase [Kaistia adipata]|uniref:homospermidine synthase n=1 Tax=Kaistia adipata TaxID=166954 RepID=UPI00041BD674|nr:saccharopine dehydrogenase C-terminal domain-containing protein [Kaistia adipata]